MNGKHSKQRPERVRHARPEQGGAHFRVIFFGLLVAPTALGIFGTIEAGIQGHDVSTAHTAQGKAEHRQKEWRDICLQLGIVAAAASYGLMHVANKKTSATGSGQNVSFPEQVAIPTEGEPQPSVVPPDAE